MICSIISSIAAESFAGSYGILAVERRKAKRLTAENAGAAEKKVAEKAQ